MGTNLAATAYNWKPPNLTIWKRGTNVHRPPGHPLVGSPNAIQSARNAHQPHGCRRKTNNIADAFKTTKLHRLHDYRVVGNPKMFHVCYKFVYEPHDHESNEPVHAQRIHTSLLFTKELNCFTWLILYYVTLNGRHHMPTRWERACVNEIQHYTQR